ncbi:hypothetical protein OG562_41930 [Streptomyces sp. NBC_01275]|nr:hypothetical protein [Streptomyces sp. NBC_01275]
MQHNPLAPDGPEAMKAFAAATRQQFPDAEYDVLRVLSDGDLVLLHSRGVLVPWGGGVQAVRSDQALFILAGSNPGVPATPEHLGLVPEIAERTGEAVDADDCGPAQEPVEQLRGNGGTTKAPPSRRSRRRDRGAETPDTAG